MHTLCKYISNVVLVQVSLLLVLKGLLCFHVFREKKILSKFVFDIKFLIETAGLHRTFLQAINFILVSLLETCIIPHYYIIYTVQKLDFIKPSLSYLQILPTRKRLTHTVGFSSLLSPYVYIIIKPVDIQLYYPSFAVLYVFY